MATFITHKALSTITDEHQMIFEKAEKILEVKRKEEHIKRSYFIWCLNAEICPGCGCEKVLITEGKGLIYYFHLACEKCGKKYNIEK